MYKLLKGFLMNKEITIFNNSGGEENDDPPLNDPPLRGGLFVLSNFVQTGN